ncbi:MAG: adenosine-specific kinase [Candidatus Hermodarchaeota archaeon]
MEFKIEDIALPEGCNIILGQSHFIKTVEDLHETLVESSPSIKFGLAFCEASEPCLVRYSGNDEELRKMATDTALKIGAGHSFVIFLKDSYPINVLQRVKTVSEVCRIFAATANPLKVIICETAQGRGILGVIDGSSPKGVETEEDIQQRQEFLRKIGYKL